MNYIKSTLIIMGFFTFLSGLLGCKAQQNNNFQSLPVSKFEQSIQDTNVIRLDVRTAQEFNAGHLKGAINIDVLQPDFESQAALLLPKGKTVAVYCRSGGRSKKAAKILSKHDFTVLELQSGYAGWVAEGKEVVK